MGDWPSVVEQDTTLEVTHWLTVGDLGTALLDTHFQVSKPGAEILSFQVYVNDPGGGG